MIVNDVPLPETLLIVSYVSSVVFLILRLSAFTSGISTADVNVIFSKSSVLADVSLRPVTAFESSIVTSPTFEVI